MARRISVPDRNKARRDVAAYQRYLGGDPTVEFVLPADIDIFVSSAAPLTTADDYWASINGINRAPPDVAANTIFWGGRFKRFTRVQAFSGITLYIDNGLGKYVAIGGPGVKQFEQAARPIWVPDGALFTFDCANLRGWRYDNGLTDLASMFDTATQWWNGVADENLATSLVAGKGLSTGPTTSSYSSQGSPFLADDIASQLFELGSFSVYAEFSGSADPALSPPYNSCGIYLALANKPSYTPALDASFTFRPAGNNQATFGDNYTTYSGPDLWFGDLGEIQRCAVNFDISADSLTGAINGQAVAALDGSTNMSSANKILIAASAGGDASHTVEGWVTKFSIFHSKSQSALTALTS